MVTQHSKNHTYLIGKESTYGTAVTADKDQGLIQDVSPTDKREASKNYATGSREVQDITYGKADFALDVELMLQHGRPLEYVFGSVSHANTTSDWKHTFDFSTVLPSFTAESSFNSTTDSVFKYSGCMCSEGTISVDKGGMVMLKQSNIAKSVDPSSASAAAAVISSIKPLHFKHFTLLTGVAGSETAPGCIQKMDLTVNNDVEGIDCSGEIEIQEAIAKNLDTTFTFDMTFANTTEYERFLGGSSGPEDDPTEFSAVFNAHNGVTLGSGRREFYTQLAGVTYEEVGTPVSVGDIVVQSFKGNSTGLGTNKAYYVDNLSDVAF